MERQLIARRTETVKLGDYLRLTKPRIVSLLLFTAFCSMVMAAHGWPRLSVALNTLGGLALSIGGAHAVNMWYDRDIDRLMARTRLRPVVQGHIAPLEALFFGVFLESLSWIWLSLAVNRPAAELSLAGFLFYVLVYTIWLKRRTPQNIVIGGAAGAFPPLVGWTAVSPHFAWTPVAMFAVIFLWTPPHFWALALYKQDDYRRANIPMMPLVQGEQATKMQALGYTLLLMLASLLLYVTGVVGLIYLVAAVVLGLGFIVYGVALLVEQKPQDRWARRTFQYSLVYMLVLFVAMVANARR
jgi:protoheme IX farnesyltransferase